MQFNLSIQYFGQLHKKEKTSVYSEHIHFMYAHTYIYVSVSCFLTLPLPNIFPTKNLLQLFSNFLQFSLHSVLILDQTDTI